METGEQWTPRVEITTAEPIVAFSEQSNYIIESNKQFWE